MKKRILSILLTLCMVLCLVPITVFAAGGAKAILPGTSAQSILKIDQSRLSFAGHEWWVIGQKTDESNNAPIITLLAVNNDFGDVPFRTGSAVPFENASRYSEDNGYYANNPSDMSQWRKPNEYAGSTLQQKMVSLAEAIPEKEQAVIRPKDITEGITGQEVKAQKLRAFSQEDSIYLYRNSCKYAAKWWTRSSNEVYGYGSWTIHPDGRSGSALNVDYDAAVRPAMEMDLSSVLFISAAEHGKVADLTTPIAEYAGDEWKLTLHDSDRDDFTAKTVLVNGSVLEVEYKNAKVGDNEYISAVIKDADGSISRYTRVVQLDGTTNGTRGRAAIDLTGIDMTGKTLCVFNEQFNGDHKTDYAGALREVKLTDEIDEQFTLTPGGTYYFDLSGANIPGTANGSLPDSTLHYVPFTYTGTVYAYSLSSNSSGVASSSQAASTAASSSAQYGYARDHSLFIADYAVAHTVSWLDLNAADLIFGKDYASGKISYALRAPSVGSNHKLGSDADEHGDPENNEWDAILNKARQDWQDNTTGYIKNWKDMYSTGQDTAEAPSTGTAQRMKRGYPSVRRLSHSNAGTPLPYDGFRPVLEVLNPGTLGSDGLKVVTLDLGGGKLGNSSENIQIIVKTGSEFTAPASDGLTRPDGDAGSFFMWLGSNGKFYAPGDSVPAEVTKLTAQWTAPTYAVTLNTNGGTINSGNVTSYTYGVGATLPTADDMTYTGYTFKGWYDNENLTGSPVTAIGGTETGNKEYWAKWEINQYTITFDTNGGSEIAPITQDYGTAITAPANPTRKGYTFKGWDKEIPKTMPAENMTVKAQWEINQYTISFDTNGGSEIAPITQDYGTKITAPADPTRKGYTFKGWDKEIPKTMPAENITVKAQWEINQYAITFDTNGGSEIAPITQDYGTNITAPADPTRKGYTFKGWDKEIPKTMPAENMTVKAQWEINQYTITFDTNGGSEIAPITQDYGTAITAPADPIRKGYTFKGWDKEIPETMPAENITITARWRDTEKPTGEIIIGTNKWNKFLNELTFGIFFKDTQEVTINAVDNSGTVFVSYLVTDKELSEAELDSLVFRAYEEPFCIDPNGEYIVYVMLVDENINITYLRSDRLTLDNIHPVIGGIENGKTYCAAQTVTITEKYVDTVTVNGTEVTLDENNSFTLAPADGEQKIVVTDKAGNTAEVTVTVNDGHTFGEWTSNGDGTHTRQCTADGCTEGIETDNCTDEDKNHICDICGNIISNHEDANQDHVCDLCGKVISNHEDADKDHVCDHCGKVISNHEDANKDHVCDYCEKVISNHEDADKDHICDLCGKTISNHEDADNNHICDYCGKTISNHEDADKDHICDHCGKVISNHEDANKDHVCDLCGKTISNHEDANKDHVCDYCGKVFSNHEDADKNHVCDCCGKVITNHIGGKETCRDKAVCEVCGKSYGKLDPKNHTDLKHFPAKAATEDADGNIEYWYCSGCNKYYSDKDGTKEIAKADTVTAKLPKSPPTGDNSNLMLWIALLFISGGVLTGVTVFDKRKRHSVK